MKANEIIPITLPNGDTVASNVDLPYTDWLGIDRYPYQYKTYWYITDKKDCFISKAASFENAYDTVQTTKKFGQWLIKSHKETEHVLSERTRINREQWQGCHSPLDKFDKIRALQVKQSLQDLKEQKRYHHAQEYKKALAVADIKEPVNEIEQAMVSDRKVKDAMVGLLNILSEV